MDCPVCVFASDLSQVPVEVTEKHATNFISYKLTKHLYDSTGTVLGSLPTAAFDKWTKRDSQHLNQ